MSDEDDGAVSRGGDGEDIRRRVEEAGEVFDRYGDEIRAIINFNVKDKAKADDIFQDLFVSVARNPVPSGVEDIRAYLCRAIANDVVDRFRRRKTRREAIQGYAERCKHRVVQKDPQNIVVQTEETTRMFRLIDDHLARREARAIVQRHGLGLSASDMAVQLNVDKRSASRYLTEAMRKMRSLVSENGGDAR